MKKILFLYNLLFPLALLFLLPGALHRMLRRGNYAHQFGQRFGWYSRNVKARLRRNRGDWIWVHAVSVGEVMLALKFIRAWQRTNDRPVLLSTTTSTGFQLAREHQSKQVEVIYHPVDFWWTIRRILKLVEPAALVLVEAEIWPNLLAGVRERNRPVVLINARLSQRSEKRFHFFRKFIAPVFASLDRIGLQEEADRARYLGLGARTEALVCTGSIKFDLEEETEADSGAVQSILAGCGVDQGRPLFLAASTHPGEEAIFGRVFGRLREEIPDLFGVVVPRHFERAGEAERDLAALSLRIVRQSRNQPQPCDLLLADTTGQLRQWTSAATLVFVGKSLTVHGGQNPAEAVSAGRPVIFGPHMENFAGLTRILLQHNGAWQVRDEEELFKAGRELLLRPDQARAMAERATKALAGHQGAARRTVDLLAQALQASNPAHAGRSH